MGYIYIWPWVEIKGPRKPQIVVCVYSINHLVLGVSNFDPYPYVYIYIYIHTMWGPQDS